MRTAKENYLKPDHMAQLAGARIGGIVPFLFDRNMAQALPDLLGVSLDEIERKMYLPVYEARRPAAAAKIPSAPFPFGTGELKLQAEKEVNNFYGTEINRDHLHLARRRFAPDALSIGGYHRPEWDVGFIFSNHETGELLHSKCRFCEKKFGWRTRGLTECFCKYDLRDHKAKPIPSELLELSAFLHDLINPCPLRQEQARSRLPSSLQAVGVSTLVDLMITVGRLAVGYYPGANDICRGLPVDREIKLMFLGFTYLPEWPASVVPAVESALWNSLNGRMEEHVSFSRIFSVVDRASLPETRGILTQVALSVWSDKGLSRVPS